MLLRRARHRKRSSSPPGNRMEALAMSRWLRTHILIGKSPGSVGCWLIVAALFALSARYVVAITDLQSPAIGSSQAVGNDDGKKPRFESNSIMVKLTPEARASLKLSGEEVNPSATG